MNNSRPPSALDRIFFVAIAGYFAVVAFIVVWAWTTSAAVLKHLAHVTAALAPVLTFSTVLVVAVGWYIVAWLNGDEARRTEREKREIANEAFRDLVRARLQRVWEVIREAVSSEKPYIPGSIDYFLDELQKMYWTVDAFAAFSHDEHELMRRALDYCRLGNRTVLRMVNDSESWDPPDVPKHVVAGDSFLQSLVELERVFRGVFGDEELGGHIGHMHNDVQAQVNDWRDRNQPQR